MNGAEGLVLTLLAGGVDTCFTNPGTSEMHIVEALGRTPEMRCVLGLFEGVVTAAADGYARMAGSPACTLLHLGPGLANGLANLHNAKRARVPIINIVGQHPGYHLRHDSPLTTDIEGTARPYSHWVRTSCCAEELGRDAAEAIVAARTSPGHISTLIVPADVAWNEGGIVSAGAEIPRASLPNRETIEGAAALLRSGQRTAILLAGSVLHGKGLIAAGRIAGAANAKLLAPYPFSRMERGAGKPLVERIPYVLDQAVRLLEEFRQLILVGSSTPVSYFAAPNKNAVQTSPESLIYTLATPDEDGAAALETVADALSADKAPTIVEKPKPPSPPSGEITLSGLASAVGALLPENAIVIDESMTSGRGMMAATQSSPPHDWLANTGGSIGIALPLAVGAAVACPDRPVLCLSADGSTMYTAQAFWTMARENLRITTVILANREYAVLKREFSYLGVGEPNRRVQDLFEIGRPDIDWVSLAKGMGVPSTRAQSLEEFARALRNGFQSQSPNLIEIRL